MHIFQLLDKTMIEGSDYMDDINITENYEYQIGVAIVKALKFNKDTLLLFYRLFKIFKQMFKNKYQKKKIRNKLSYKTFRDNGKITYAYRLLNMSIFTPKSPYIINDYKIISDKVSLYNMMKILDVKNCVTNNYKITKKINKILLVLNTSAPYLNNGYAIRSNMIIKQLKKFGYTVYVITRPGFPNDIKDKKVFSEKLVKEEINGVIFYRNLPNIFLRNTKLTDYITVFSKVINQVIEIEDIDLVHAASNYVIGLAAMTSARENNLPFIYEIRGFWEKTNCTKVSNYYNSEAYTMQSDLETFVAKNATKVVVISKGLKDVLINRGVDKQKISIISNGVSEIFKPAIKVENLETFNIGYIGSIVKYEGLEKILLLMKELILDGYLNIRFFFAGIGPNLNNFLTKIKIHKLDDYVTYLGSISHCEVPLQYRKFDVCIFPRINEEVTNLVTPIKPLEAMASGKVVIVSDLKAMHELIEEEVTGLFFDHSILDLKRQLLRIYHNDAFKSKIAKNAYQFIKENKYYEKICVKYQYVYESSD